jgi:hypothetical protein
MLNFVYKFSFPETDEKPFYYKFNLDDKTLLFNTDEAPNPNEEDWTKLEFCKCENCTIIEEDQPFCPIAKNLSNIAFFFKDVLSHKKARVFVETNERMYGKDVTVQEGLFSIFGLIMATSGCPSMDFLKPMARFHLPFSTVEETFSRVASFHLLEQYLIREKNKTDDKLSLSGLIENYKSVATVNKGILARISEISTADAEKNAVIILDGFSQLISAEIGESLDTLNDLFDI